MERRLSTLSEAGKDCYTNGKTEGTEYIPARCRITKPSPPKPAQNPLQFVKVGPCDLYRSAQEQLKKVEVIKKVKQEFKDEGEDWQSNLDNWKSSRRKRQEHIIERVVEIKNMEQEQEKSRRRSKTFSEMLEDRSSRRRKASIVALYSESDGNDLSDLGISTPSRKGSISGDSTIDDTTSMRDSDEHSSSVEQSNSLDDQNIVYKPESNNNGISPPTTTKCEEYTYESAIQDYKSRVKRRSYNDFPELQSDPIGTPNKSDERRLSLYTFQTLSVQSNDLHIPPLKADVPKVDISERKQLFESGKKRESNFNTKSTSNLPDDLSQSKSIKERLKHLEKCTEESLKIKKATKILSGDIMTVRDRLSSLVSHTSEERNNNMPSWSSASQLTSSTETNPATSLDKSDQEDIPGCHHVSLCHIDKGRMFHCSLDSLDIRGETTPETCTLEHVQSLDGLDYCERSNYPPSGSSTELLALSQCGDTDREDSGIQTADVSCSVSQADDPDDDSDTMAAINTVCVEQHLITSNELPLTYLTSVELQPHPVSPELSGVTSLTPKSEPSVVEELITCTINMDLRNKIVFDESTTLPKDPPIQTPTPLPISDPLAPPKSVEPPKEKPPPPPVDLSSDEDYVLPTNEESELKRLNSTKRIKNEIRNKRSSFLGIEGLTDINDLEMAVTKPPDANTILQEELQLEKLLYKQSQTYQQMAEFNNHMEVESRDSGVELESRSISEHYPLTETDSGKISQTNDEDEISKKEREIIENLEKEEQWRHSYCGRNNINRNSEILEGLPAKILIDSQQTSLICDNDNEDTSTVESRYPDEDVLRVERELLVLEKEELERQREDVIFQNRKANVLGSHQKPPLGISDVYLKQSNRPTDNIYSNYPNYYPTSTNTSPPMLPTMRPTPPTSNYSKMQLPIPSKPLRSEEVAATNTMSRHTLHALSAAPRSKLMNTDSWIQSQPTKKLPTLTSTQDRENYNQHWLIQEAEQRRLSEPPRPARGHFSHRSSEKHIPDAVVQTLTQRLQNRPSPVREPNHVLNRKDLPVARGAPVGYERGRSLPNAPITAPLVAPPPPPVVPPPSTVYDLRDKMLSVSGKKKCSHCGDELGRGAAMIIESLCLFYHMDCFKCCVCHVQLGDGLMGTDVRVRNHKLHCHNCYSSDDGVKFSCV